MKHDGALDPVLCRGSRQKGSAESVWGVEPVPCIRKIIPWIWALLVIAEVRRMRLRRNATQFGELAVPGGDLSGQILGANVCRVVCLSFLNGLACAVPSSQLNPLPGEVASIIKKFQKRHQLAGQCPHPRPSHIMEKLPGCRLCILHQSTSL